MATDEAPQPLSEEITSSLATVWKRYSTVRPTNGSTEVQGNVVRCQIPNAVRDFETGLNDCEDSIDPADRLRSYRREAAAAVAKSTRCRVVAMISERDADTDLASEVFVLDTAPRRTVFGDRDWIAS